MSNIKRNNEINFRIEIGSNNPRTWSEKEIAEVKDKAKENAKKTIESIRNKKAIRILSLKS